MRLPERNLATGARNAARADRAGGGHGSLADAKAGPCRGPGAGQGLASALTWADERLASLPGEILAAGRERAERVRSERAAAPGSGATARAQAIHTIVATLERVALLATQWKNTLADPDTLFGTWLALQRCKKLAIDLAIDDTKLIRKVAVSCALVERHAAGLGLVPFDGVLREMADVVDGLHACFLLQMSCTPNDQALTGGNPHYPDWHKLCSSLALAYGHALGDLEALHSRCTELRPRLLALAEFGLLVAGPQGFDHFSPEFSAVDGPCARPDDERLCALAAHFQLPFEHANPTSPITLTARAILAEDGTSPLVGHCRQRLHESYEALLTEKRRQIHVLRARSTIPDGWNKIDGAEHYFIDLRRSLNSMGFLAQFRFSRQLQASFYVMGAIAGLPFITALASATGNPGTSGFGAMFACFAISSAFIAGGEWMRAERNRAGEVLESELAGIERDMAVVESRIRGR